MAETEDSAAPAVAVKDSQPADENDAVKANGEGDESLNDVCDDLDGLVNEECGEDGAEDGAGGDDKLTEEDKKNFLTSPRNPTIKLFGLKKPNSLKIAYADYVKFFKEIIKVEKLPLIQNPSGDDETLSFKFQTLGDKRKLYDYVKKTKPVNRPAPYKKLIIKAAFTEKAALLKNVEITKEITLDEALDILYPKRNVLYADQLAEKNKIVKTLIEEHVIPIKEIEKLPGNRKYLKSVKPRNMVPFSPIDGYENHVIVYVEKTADGEVKCGARVVDTEKGYNTIVPLESCVGIPRQTALAAKKILSGLQTVGLEPICPGKEEGELLGFALKISDMGKFILTVILKRPPQPQFYEFDENGIVLKEGEVLGDAFTDVMEKNKLHADTKLTNFFENEGKTMGIQGIHLSWCPEFNMLYFPASRLWNHLPKPDFVTGNEVVIDRLNGTLVKTPWDRERHTEVHKLVLPLFDASCFTSESTVYLFCPFLDVGLYFSKRCAKVIQSFFWTKDYYTKLNDFAKSHGVKNITYNNFHMLRRRPPPAANTLMVWWPFLNNTTPRRNSRLKFLKIFINNKFLNHVFISYWSEVEEKLLPFQKTQMELVYTDLKIMKIIPFDLEPYKNGFGVLIHAKGAVADGDRAPGGGGPGARNRPLPAGYTPANRRSGGVGGDRRQDGRGGRGGPGGPPPVWRDEMRREVRAGGGRPSVHQRLGPRPVDYAPPQRPVQGPFSDPWNQGPPPSASWNELERVAGVVQNIQSMAHQMQAYFEQRQAMDRAPPSKRKFDEGGERSGGGFSRRGGSGAAQGGGGSGGWAERQGRGRDYDAGEETDWAADSYPGRDSNPPRDYNHQETKRRKDDFTQREVSESWGGGSAADSGRGWTGGSSAGWTGGSSSGWIGGPAAGGSSSTGGAWAAGGGGGTTGWGGSAPANTGWGGGAQTSSSWWPSGGSGYGQDPSRKY